MKPIITVLSKSGHLVNYIKDTSPENINNHQKQHKLRIKHLLYNQIFTFYHKEMNFTNSNIVVDNR